jgi:MerR family transcriptional regulator, heat shock protein HspR
MDWPELDHGVFAISVAAELSGLHPQTLRIYEREGLVEPGRSAGGTRLYSGGDVARLREIAALIDGGLNIAGIKRVLELQEELRRLQSEVERLSAEAELPTPHAQSSRGERRAARPRRQ